MNKNPRTLVLLLNLGTLAVVLGSACVGPDGDPEMVVPPTAIDVNDSHGHSDHDEARDAALLRLSSTEEFRQAAERLTACLLDAGFSQGPEGVRLKDGTSLRLAEGFKVTFAVADYLMERERCEVESGVAGLMQAAGVADPPLDQAAVRALNEANTRATACLEARGWQFHEARSFDGILVIEPVLTPGEQDAYDLDEAECRQETASP